MALKGCRVFATIHMYLYDARLNIKRKQTLFKLDILVQRVERETEQMLSDEVKFPYSSSRVGVLRCIAHEMSEKDSEKREKNV